MSELLVRGTALKTHQQTRSVASSGGKPTLWRRLQVGLDHKGRSTRGARSGTFFEPCKPRSPTCYNIVFNIYIFYQKLSFQSVPKLSYLGLRLDPDVIQLWCPLFGAFSFVISNHYCRKILFHVKQIHNLGPQRKWKVGLVRMNEMGNKSAV